MLRLSPEDYPTIPDDVEVAVGFILVFFHNMLRFGLFTMIVSLIVIVVKSVVVINLATGFWIQL
jgi:hypothetical protein